MEELIARFTLGSLNKFQKHLVPLPWQRRYETDKSSFNLWFCQIQLIRGAKTLIDTYQRSAQDCV